MVRLLDCFIIVISLAGKSNAGLGDALALGLMDAEGESAIIYSIAVNYPKTE